jgi:Domain of unknown function (DUF6754)
MTRVRFSRKKAFKGRALRWLAPLFLLASIGLQAQPLTTGVEFGEQRFFLEDDQVKMLSRDGRVETLSIDSIAKAKILVQPSEGWQDSFLIIGERAAAFLEKGSEIRLVGPVGEAEQNLQWSRWGDSVILHLEGTKDLHLVNSEGAVTTLESPNSVSEPYVLDEEHFFVLSNDGYMVFQRTDLGNPENHDHPFGKDAEVTVSGDRILLWSKKSNEAILVGGRGKLSLDRPPVNGVKALGPSEFVLGLNGSLIYVTRFGTTRVLPSPRVMTPEIFSDAAIFLEGKSLHLLFTDQEAGLTSMNLRIAGRASGGILGKEVIKAVILPGRGDGHRPFLLTETSLQEPKVEASGKVVIDPRTGEVEQHTVNGHVLYILNRAGQWRALRNEPRSRLVGPIQEVQGEIILATQTEPPHRLGIKREVDSRYPYPPVVLYGVNGANGAAAWTLELPRGEAPAAARMPEKVWPLLNPTGPLLYTTEDKRLSGLNPISGKVEWTSRKLPFDDSRPVMIRWKESLGLIAAKSTSKKLLVFNNDGKLTSSHTLTELFNSQRTWNLVGVVVICLALLIYIYLAGKKDLFIRRIAGLEALDEAVGRATEMGKPVLYVTGLADVDDIQTLAALSILSHVAKKTAEYDTAILATTSRAVTFSAAQEVVRDAFTIAGRPDSFSVESVQYISDDQFGYAAGVDGMMVREEPAANFYMGKFYAESLIFAETGHATGAIQIAGTAQANQLPFFVAACDYTLIGEELFAASAYLSGDPLQVGSLRGQDVGKAIVMLVLVIASFDATFNAIFGWSVISYLGAMLS